MKTLTHFFCATGKLRLICHKNLCLLLCTFAFAANVAAQTADSKPVIENTFLDPYFDFKQQFEEDTGFTWQVNYSAMGLQRLGDTEDSHWTGQLDLIGSLEAFNGKGQFLVYYMDIELLSGLSNSDFSARNGNITGITDSDKSSFLRQAWYRHSFSGGAVTVEVGKTEPLLTFGWNNFAVNDRENFMVVPMSNVAAKDRLASSPGIIAKWNARDWLTVAATINDIQSEDATDQFEDATFYYILHANFQPRIGDLGESNFRFSYVVTEGDKQFEGSNGVIISLDQDLGDRWGVFARYDDTEFQTQTSALNQSFSFGVAHKTPFDRSGDKFGAGVFSHAK